MLSKLKEVPTVSKMRSALQYQFNKIRKVDNSTKDAVFGKVKLNLKYYTVENNPSSGHKIIKVVLNDSENIINYSLNTKYEHAMQQVQAMKKRNLELNAEVLLVRNKLQTQESDSVQLRSDYETLNINYRNAMQQVQAMKTLHSELNAEVLLQQSKAYAESSDYT
jgi:hypothetical protein